MKTTHLAFLLALLPSILFRDTAEAQTITITFAGTLSGNTVPLDSIRVENLTAGGDTTLHFPDHELVLGSVGIEEAALGVDLMRSMPNPFRGSTEIMVTSTGGEMLITVIDATGRVSASQRVEAMPGGHRFRFTSGTPGVHTLSMQQNGQRCTYRMVAMEGADHGTGTLDYIGLSGLPAGAEWAGRSKSDRSLFSWQLGDELRYTGYAGNNGSLLSGVLNDTPSASGTITFIFLAGGGIPCSGPPIVTDIDGNTYSVVQIGGQCWMAENLRTTHYRDGTAIPHVTGNAAWVNLTTGAWCNYINAPDDDAVYGRLYNWYAAANPDICPLGWHVPTDAEWQIMETALGMPEEYLLSSSSERGEAQNVGGQMKAMGTREANSGHWYAPNTGATNESGFSGQPGGYRYDDGNFYTLGNYGNWWSASDFSTEYAWFRRLRYNRAGISRGAYQKKDGYCIRCLRD